MVDAGQIIILNGPPRAGKSSIVTVVQDTFDGVWMNIGVDNYQRMTPSALQPGIGLRPGGERPDLERHVLRWYTAMYRSIAVHSRLGFGVVVDGGLHEHYAAGLGVPAACARELVGLPVLFAGLRCPVDVTLERRRRTWGRDVPREPVELWHDAVHRPGVYDLELDTSVLSPQECAVRIARRLRDEPAPDAFHRLRSLAAYGRANR